VAQQLARARNEINTLDLQKEGQVVRLEKLASEKIQIEEERTRLEARLQEFAANVETEKLNVQHQRGTVEERQARLREIQQELTRVAAELDAALRLQADKRSRLNILEQLVSEHEGFSAGTLAALNPAQQQEVVLGTLADKIRVPNEYVPALEAVLGHHLQAVLTEQPETAHHIIAELSAGKKGRASIAALALMGPTSPTPAEGASGLPPLPCAVSVVTADECARPFLNRLLGQTFIAPDLAAATAAWRSANGAFDFVTLQGDLLSRHGVFTGGYANGAGKGAASILARKNQIGELQTSLADVQTQVEEISRRKGALASEQTELLAGLQQAQAELRAQEVAIATREGEFSVLQSSLRMLGQKIDTVAYEHQSLTAQGQEGLREREALAAQVAELEARERSATARTTELGSHLDTLRQQRDAATAALGETKVALATEEQLSASFRQQQQPLEQRIRELTAAAEQRRQEIGTFATRKTQYETEAEDSRRRIIDLNTERERVSEETAGLVSQKDDLAANIATRDDGLRQQRQRLAELQQQRGSLEVELAQKGMAVQNLRERIQQKYNVVLDDVRGECITITLADEGAPKVQTLTPEEMAQAGVATDWNLVADQGQRAAAKAGRDGAGQPRRHRRVRGNRATPSVPQHPVR
jgi:chromosome segregation protein